MRKNVLMFGGAFLIFLLDYITKLLVIAKIPLSQSVSIFPPVLLFTHVQNYGAGFSILYGQKIFLILISIAVLVTIGYYYTNIPEKGYVKYAVMFLLGGILGNLLERIIKGYVVDFIHIGWWPKFNIADSAIVIGCVGLAYYFWKEEKEEKAEKNKENEKKNDSRDKGKR